MVFDTFTAANTAKGFYSAFDKLIYDDSLDRVYLIKGGPGCGKSTLMKKIAKKFEGDNLTVERIHCSSDPESLDGVKVYEKNFVIIDATAPHAYDMTCPGAYESIIDMSKFWNDKKLQKNRDEIKQLFTNISNRYKSVYSILRTAGSVESWKASITEGHILQDIINAQIRKFIKQNAIAPIESTPKTEHRLISAFSGDGVCTFSDTVYTLCNEVAVFDDGLNISHIPMQKLLTVFTKMGYDTVQLHSPLFPETRLEGLLIPQLRLGFISKGHLFSPYIDDNKVIKILNTKNYIDKEFYSQNKNKLTFAKKLSLEIISTVYDELKLIKAEHDELEKYYINATDFNLVNRFCDELISRL